ncbi:hypothetical protein HanXRQr2_Chr03g0121401 [Helianthus annuus]|uniref:Uncharacterized protein n=1 Tax=Helianthus annuus TaxID=4232 RepID=A0A9K3JHT6_HELAN|nr:hypothetical protein HanXRQr2_Chr03g0121401 [Helianthus annuus]
MEAVVVEVEACGGYGGCLKMNDLWVLIGFCSEIESDSSYIRLLESASAMIYARLLESVLNWFLLLESGGAMIYARLLESVLHLGRG